MYSVTGSEFYYIVKYDFAIDLQRLKMKFQLLICLEIMKNQDWLALL
jgi:hypothetical protein